MLSPSSSMSWAPSAWDVPPTLLPMSVADIESVMSIEQRAYSFPWTRGNFTDSLAAGYAAWVLMATPAAARRADRTPQLLGYYVAMAGFEEMHLLNITVAPEAQGQGHAVHMLHHLADLSQRAQAHSIWLEVRQSNERARAVYLRWGFAEMGRRKAYYPAAAGQREDAVLMSWRLEADHALD